MASFRNHKVSCSEILPSYQQAGEVELREHPFEETGKTEGEYVKSDSHQDILVDNAKNSAYNNELLRKRRKRLIFILLIAAVTTVLLVVVATVPFLLGSRKPTDDMNSGDVKKATGEEEQTQCQSFSHLVANGHLVCNGEDVNSTCWTVCIEGYKKEDSLIGSYMCGLNGQWSGEATTCVPKDCGTPYQNGTAKEVQPCPKPPGVCQIPIRDGVLNCTGTTYRHSCEVTCNDNFRGNLSFLVCESDGRWSSLDVGCLPEDPCTNNTCNKVNGSCIQVSNNQHALCRCNVGFAGNGIHCQLDSDLDGFPDVQLPCEEKHCKVDNCPLIPNSGQENSDQDPDGNVCDFDDDNDHINDTNDNCQFDSNPGQEDRDNDTIGDACDNCINVFNTDQTDTDGDGTGDVCEPGGDVDNDGVSRGDNCRVVPNPGQEDRDRDGVGDVCDNCADVSNMQQNDTDQNLIGDACEEKADNDGDGVSDGRDNCQSLPNGDQMYALVAWNFKNGVPLGREELEVQSRAKLTVMNGGKLEPGATVNMLFKREIWGGTIQSIHGSKKDAEDKLEGEVEMGESDESSDAKRNRKRKSYGDDFEETDEGKANGEESDESTCSAVCINKQDNGPAKKTKKKATGGKENGKKGRVPSEARQQEIGINAQHDELVIEEILGTSSTSPVSPLRPIQLSPGSVPPAHPHFGGKQPKQHRPPLRCINVTCREEKDKLKEELAAALEELKTLKTLQPCTLALESTANYGKVPRSVGIANNWEEISNGVWCCPIKVKAAVKNACSRTGLACVLLSIFYPKEKLKGQRLHELDNDVVEAITDFSMVAKITKEPPMRKVKEGEQPKPPSPVSRSAIKQAMRIKCNTIICLEKKKLDCDTDMLGDACDSDQDGDGILNNQDNCPLVSNPDQADKDGDGVGDVCVGDTDGDGIMDYQDDYPLNKFLNRTDFSLYQEVLLDDEGKAQVPPKWIIFDKGQAVVQTANGNPGLMLSYTKFGHLDYTGTFYISDTRDDDFAGLVFGYQSNRHFYVCSWKKLTQTYNIPGLPYPRSVGRRGIHLMAINSTTGPGESLRDALWETGNTINQSHMLWYDPAPRWSVGVAYRWRLIHDPDSGRIRIRWYNGIKLISDSGNIVNKRYRGGRVGMYVFSQEGVRYSALHARSPKITDYALSFDGVDEYGDLGAFSDILDQNSSFTLAAWVWITGANGQAICSLPPIDFGNLTSDLGFLLQSVDDEENWKLIKTGTPTSRTGPTADHTSGSGFYAYLESSGIAKGTRASLETPWFATSDGCNVSFFYHMFDNSSSGDSMGTLCVEVKTEREPWFMVFWRGGNQGNSWHQGNVDLSVYKGLVAVRFTAAKGKSYYSDIALDDVSFSPSCGVSSTCSRPEVLPIFGTKEGTGVHLSVSGGKVQGGVSDSQPIKGNLSFVYNTWTHVALQYSSETKQQSLYVNGRLDQVVNNTSFNLISKNLLLGQNGAKNFRGQIDEVQIWKFPVNESVFYDKYLEGNEKGLVRYYKCNDKENKLKDSSPSKKDGLLHGTGRLSSSLELRNQD